MTHVLASLILLASSSLASAEDMLVTPDWLVEHRGEKNLVLLHVGVPADFEKEHIPGAIPVNPQDLSIPRTEGALALQLLPPDQLHAKVEALGIARIPAVAVLGETVDHGIRFYGLPSGYEFGTLVDAMLLVSSGQSGLGEKTRSALRDLARPLHIQVFSTPT